MLVHNTCNAGDGLDDNIDDIAGAADNAIDDYVNMASERRTEHILYGDETGGDGKTPFPQDWSAEEIMHQISDIATDPSLEWIPNRKYNGVQRYEVIGERLGETIKVIADGSDIITAFPLN